jgi:imidazolonepropionase-like amidohydrolase
VTHDAWVAVAPKVQTAGVPPMVILRSATSISAATLNFAEPVGKLAAGFRSRIVLTQHDPLATVANLQKQKTIFFDGAIVHAPDDVNTQGL